MMQGSKGAYDDGKVTNDWSSQVAGILRTDGCKVASIQDEVYRPVKADEDSIGIDIYFNATLDGLAVYEALLGVVECSLEIILVTLAIMIN